VESVYGESVIGFERASRLLAGNTAGGIDAAFAAIAIALTLVYGLLVSASLFPPDEAGAEASPTS
jgi:hypothetical protein